MAPKLEGQEAMKRRLDRIAAKVPDQVGKALYVEANLIMTASKQRYVPVAADGGTLMNSGHVQLPQRKGSEVSVNMVYGGPAAAYALAHHEHPSDASPPSWEGKPVLDYNRPGSGPKYLERPMMEVVNGMAQRIARRLGVEELVK